MNTTEKKLVIKSLNNSNKENRVYHSDIPAEFKDDIDIIITERKKEIRKIEKKGFDVIKQLFFVCESLLCCKPNNKEEYWIDNILFFNEFDKYFDYVEGEIYNNSCYYQCDISKINRELDKEKFFKQKSFIDYDIDDYSVTSSAEEKIRFQEGERIKKQVKKWIDKFNGCVSFDSFFEMVESYNHSILGKKYDVDIVFFFWQYIFFDLNDRNRFDIILKYISTGQYPEDAMIFSLCHVYDPDDVLKSYNYSFGEQSTIIELKNYVENIKKRNRSNRIKTKVFFDEKTHFYCELSEHGVYRYFETFEELIKYRNGDLTNTDLTNDINLKYDFSKCNINRTTKLPIDATKEYKYIIEKKYIDNHFTVIQKWYKQNRVCIKQYEHEFCFFFDFVAFLKGDLSGSDLTLCDGLINLSDISDINFKDAHITSFISDKFGLNYQKYIFKTKMIDSFDVTEENEKNTEVALCYSRELEIGNNALNDSRKGYDESKEQISYLTDLHLMHKLKQFNSKSKEDVEYVIKRIVINIVNETKRVLLIGGDIASDYEIFKIFIKLLRKELDRRYKDPYVFFVLGNHELWKFSNLSFEEIVVKYEQLINKKKMYLLQNEIIYLDSGPYSGNILKMNRITNEELNNLSSKEIRDRLRIARIIIFGGLGFSGYNKNFNANNGIYRITISRKKEIEESKKFERLYNKLLSAIPDKELIVFTHTPMDCWCKKTEYHKGYIYVNGHTHRNYFYDDGETRVYADNQIGYANNNPHLKWFDADKEFDFFCDYKDGIYEITKEDYLRFYLGKNKRISFNQNVYIIYMLKKKGYYCFIHKTESGLLTILNGGRKKNLKVKDINYYFENMDSVIANLKKPLDKYTAIQKEVSQAIQRIGGNGSIHGCIIDVDWNNHVYINPIDMKITCYWAPDMINKKTYSSLPVLLEKECPEMYEKYIKLINSNSQDVSVLAQGMSNDVSVLPQTYLDTDIYRVSREISKMQKLNSNILQIWVEVDNSRKMIEKKNKKS